MIEHDFSHPAIIGASCRSGPARVIAVAKRARIETTRRFVLGHELGHHLMDLDIEGTTIDEAPLGDVRFWMESSSTEKRANAFAAMLLAPEGAVRESLGPPKSAGYGLEQARQLVRRGQTSFGLGFSAMAWHLHNLSYIRSSDTVHALLVEADPSAPTGFESDRSFDGLVRRVSELRERLAISSARERELLNSSF